MPASTFPVLERGRCASDQRRVVGRVEAERRVVVRVGIDAVLRPGLGEPRVVEGGADRKAPAARRRRRWRRRRGWRRRRRWRWIRRRRRGGGGGRRRAEWPASDGPAAWRGTGRRGVGGTANSGGSRLRGDHELRLPGCSPCSSGRGRRARAGEGEAHRAAALDRRMSRRSRATVRGGAGGRFCTRAPTGWAFRKRDRLSFQAAAPTARTWIAGPSAAASHRA